MPRATFSPFILSFQPVRELEPMLIHIILCEAKLATHLMPQFAKTKLRRLLDFKLTLPL